MMNIDYLEENKDISNLSNFKTKAEARYYFELKNRQDIDKLREVYLFAKENNIEILFVWGGTNLLFAFDIFNWIVINNCLEWWTYDKDLKKLESYSNEKISDIAKKLYNDGQDLWKRFIWLPWSIWGAVYWNAWCFWLEIENNFLEVELLDLETWEVLYFDKSKMDFEYRSSIIKKNNNKYFIIKTVFDLSNKVEKYSSDVDNIEFRENKQPKGNCCWSFFKNPSKENSAWSLIESVWLKWQNIWTAFFSEKHANFLMSEDNWNYKDLIKLISEAQTRVKKEYWIDLVPEVRIIYN